MARESIFECKQPMPPADNSPDVVRTALCYDEARRNLRPAMPYSPTNENSVQSVARPRFGRDT
jgi:hypothetical protein